MVRRITAVRIYSEKLVRWRAEEWGYEKPGKGGHLGATADWVGLTESEYTFFSMLALRVRRMGILQRTIQNRFAISLKIIADLYHIVETALPRVVG